MNRFLSLIFLGFFFITSISSLSAVYKENIKLAIIKDGPSEVLDGYILKFRENLLSLAKDSSYTVEFVDFDSDWNIDKVKENINSALADFEVDFIFVNGFLASTIAADPELELNKPTISSNIHKTNIVKYPETGLEKTSLKKNFSFIKSPQNFEREIEVFQDLIDFDSLHVLVDAKSLAVQEGLMARIDEFNANHQNLSIKLIPYEASLDSIKDAINIEKPEAIYIASLPRMQIETREEIISFINSKKIPSFSGFGVKDLELGALATISPDLSERIAKRIALNIHKMLILDTKAEDLALFMPVDENLILNAKTASEIDYYPDFKTELSAEFLYKESLKDNDLVHEDLSLDTAISLAGERNINLKISGEEVKQSGAKKNRSLSNLLPQALLSTRFTAIDNDRAEASKGITPSSSTRLGVGVTQMIFDDELITNFRSARKSFKGQEFLYDLERFDAMLEGGDRFLKYLSELELLKIEVENFKLVQSNLDLAQSRFQVGKAGREEVYRWEAEKAESKSSVLRQEAIANQSRIALNQTLNKSQDRTWDIDKDLIDAYNYGPLRKEIRAKIKNRKFFAKLRRFLVQQAYDNSPELASFDKQIEAQNLKLNQLKRRFILPKLSTSLAYLAELQADREGLRASEINEANNNQFEFSINAEYSIFEGAGKYFDVKREGAILRKLKNQRERARQFIEQETLATLYSIGSSAPNIYLTKTAAENANKNLDVIRNKYSSGKVDIITLIDAQSQAFSQNQQAAIAEFTYLKDVINLERAISWFPILKSDEEKKQFSEGFDNFE